MKFRVRYGFTYCERACRREWPRRERRNSSRHAPVGLVFVIGRANGEWICGGCGKRQPRPSVVYEPGSKRRHREVDPGP